MTEPEIDVALEDDVSAMVGRVQVLQSAASVLVLIPAAWARMRSGQALPFGLGLLEIGAIVLACGSAIRELRSRPTQRRGFDWLNAFLGAVLFLEYGFSVASGGKRVSPTLLTGLASWALVILRPRLEARRRARRRMKADGEALTISMSALRRFHVRWAELAAIDETGSGLRFRLRDGSTKKLSLRRYANRDELRRVLRAAATVAGVAYRES